MKKVILKVEINEDKSKKIAMKVVSGISGVEAIAANMKDKKLTIIGDFDPVHVVSKLRKLYHTDIIYVGQAKEEKKDESKTDDKKKDPTKEKVIDPIPLIFYGSNTYYNQMKPQYSPYYSAVLRSSSRGLLTSPVVRDVARGSQRDVTLQIFLRDPSDHLPPPLVHILSKDYKNKIWRIVGLMSTLGGLSCFALSPSFCRLIRGWNAWKLILYEVFSLVVLIAFFFAEKSSRTAGDLWYKIKGFAILMFIAVYTFYYDKAVDGKPEILSLVANAAFVLMSLSYSKLAKYAHEMGVFSFFLSCLTIQLWIINWKLIFVAICFGFPLFYVHSSSDPHQDREIFSSNS